MKVWNYIFLVVGLSILFEFSGFITSGGILGLIGFQRIGEVLMWSPTTSGIYNAVLGSTGILIGIGTGIIVGFFTRSSPENFIILPLITGTFGLFIQLFVSIINYSIANTSLWITGITSLIMIPLGISFFVSIVEFFRGTD